MKWSYFFLCLCFSLSLASMDDLKEKIVVKEFKPRVSCDHVQCIDRFPIPVLGCGHKTDCPGCCKESRFEEVLYCLKQCGYTTNASYPQRHRLPNEKEEELFQAAFEDLPDIVRFFDDREVDINVRCFSEATFVYQDTDVALPVKFEHGETALTIAAYAGSLNAVQRLVQAKNIDINAQTTDGRTALWEACSCTNSRRTGQYSRIVDALLDAEARPDIHSKPTSTPLANALGSNALRSGQASKIVLALLLAGADPNHGRPLLYCQNDNNLKQLLLNAGADEALQRKEHTPSTTPRSESLSASSSPGTDSGSSSTASSPITSPAARQRKLSSPRVTLEEPTRPRPLALAPRKENGVSPRADSSLASRPITPGRSSASTPGKSPRIDSRSSSTDLAAIAEAGKRLDEKLLPQSPKLLFLLRQADNRELKPKSEEGGSAT